MKIYRYCKHIRWLRVLFPGLSIVFVVILLFWLFPTRYPALPLALAAIFLIEAAVIWWVFGRFAAVEVSLGNNGIAYRSRKRLIEIPYDQITKIQHPSIRYLGGWIMIRSDTDTIRLTVVLDGIGDFVRNLKEELDQRDLSSAYQKGKLFQFYKTAENGDQSMDRFYERFGRIAFLIGLSLAIGWMLGRAVSGEKSMGFDTVFWTIGSGLCATLIFATAEIFLARRLAKGADESHFQVPERDRATENRIFKNALSIGAALYCVAMIVVLLMHFGAP